jgi:hypothetical protein
MAISDIVARLTLNATQFRAQFDTAIDQASTRARQGGRQIGENLSTAANGALDELAARIPVVGGALGGLAGPALAAAAGIGAISVALAAGIREADAYAQEAGKLDAVLKATGNTTGFTAEQLRGFADELEGTFAISAEEFLAAERQLSSFKGIAGSTFTDVLALSADLSATFGGDLSSNAEKLGTVLQNLASGDVEGLGRGFKFLGTEALETVKALAEQGRTFEAQQALIDALRQRVGGAGEAAGDNLTGDFFRLKDAIGDSARALAENSGAYDAARDYVQRLAKEVGFLGELFGRIGGGDRPTATPGALPRLPLGLEGGGAEQLQAQFDARRAAEAAKAEADKRRASEAAAAAQERQAKAAAAAAKAAQDQAKALNGALDDLKFQAELAGKTTEEARRLTTLRNLERQYGPLITAEVRLQAEAYLGMADSARQVAEAQKQIIRDFEATTSATRLKGLDDAVRDFLKDGIPSADDPETRRRFEFTANSFFEILSRGQGSFWQTFEQLGFRSISNLAAQFAQSGGLGGLFSDGNVQNFGIGSAIGSLLGGGRAGTIGGGIGGLAGGAVGGPLGTVAGSAIGSVLGGLVNSIGPTSRAFRNLSTDNAGQFTQAFGGARGTQKEQNEQAAIELANAFGSSLSAIAAQLGGSLASGVNLGALGSAKGKFEFLTNPTTRDGFNTGGTVTAFDTPEEAIAAALRNAVSKGAITGIDQTVARLLSQGDLQTQLGKAAALANALRSFDSAANPFADQVRVLNQEFAALRDIMIEAGSSTADLNRASGEYDRRLQAIKDSAAQATATLRGFLESLGFGSSSPLSLGDQRQGALAAFNSQASRIGQDGFDQQAFVQAGQRLLDIEGQIFGRTDSFFATFQRVQEETNRAITAINNASAITGDNPFQRATAQATQATAENTAAIAEGIISLPANLAQQIAAALAAGGVAGADGRGFVYRDAA